jgi:hypothetical protein
MNLTCQSCQSENLTQVHVKSERGFWEWLGDYDCLDCGFEFTAPRPTDANHGRVITSDSQGLNPEKI